MADLDTAPQPRKVETEIVARCAHCKAPLYVETIVEELHSKSGELVEVGRTTVGDSHPTCCCRREESP